MPSQAGPFTARLYQQPGPSVSPPARSGLVPTWNEELRLWDQGYHAIAGVDEVGRGPLAGPVVAAAVILNPTKTAKWHGDLRDSKVLSSLQRQRLAAVINDEAQAVGLGFVTPEDIDSLGIVRATKMAMTRAISGLSVNPDHLIIDSLPLPEAGLPFRAIVKGDALCRSVSAASIVAKVARDDHMNMEDSKYPGYGFARHKGYGTSDHLKQLVRLGPCPIHRRSFAPVRVLVQPLVEIDPHKAMTRGRAAEDAVVQYLENRGYRVVERNFTCRWGEIDLVAYQGKTIAFVEVKARRSDALELPWESATPNKQRKLILTAQAYLQARGLEIHPWRIDIVAASMGLEGKIQSLEHLENAISGF
jgi:uncharacterized protein (TIGR00252 family)